jgi:quercetin dioxygenase-like cupin family protein
MRTMQLMDGLQFKEEEPFAEPLFVDKDGRILRFCLRPLQSIDEHTVPHSPFYVVILKGQGIFTDGHGQEKQIGPNSLIVFDPGEKHAVRALGEELVFVGFLHGVPGTREERVGGTMGES